MSRKTIEINDQYSFVKGHDHMLGKFYQLYDKASVDETPEGEGLIFEWSEKFGYETNHTEVQTKENVHDFVFELLKTIYYYDDDIEDFMIKVIETLN